MSGNFAPHALRRGALVHTLRTLRCCASLVHPPLVLPALVHCDAWRQSLTLVQLTRLAKRHQAGLRPCSWAAPLYPSIRLFVYLVAWLSVHLELAMDLGAAAPCSLLPSLWAVLIEWRFIWSVWDASQEDH